MIVAVDIGNSSLKAAAFSDAGERLAGERARRPYDLSTDNPLPDAASIADTLSGVASGPPSLVRVAFCSVVPRLSEVIRVASADTGWSVPFEIAPDTDLPFAVSYDSRQTLGADRIAAVAGAWYASRRDGRPMLVIDAGTATTIEVVDRQGNYLGGPILPGANLMRRALAGGTAQLPEAHLEVPASAIGRDTGRAVQSGVMWGFVEGVRGVTRRILQEVGADAVVIATGGAGDLLAEHISEIDEVRPELVLEGVAALATGPSSP